MPAVLSDIEFFDSIAEQWDSWEPEDMPQRLQRVVSLAAIAKGMRVLDVGTGTGALLPHLAERLGEGGSILAIDPSAGMLREAAKKDPPSCCSFDHICFEEVCAADGSFDRVMMNAVFPHLEDKESALEKAHRLLKTGGRIVISHPIGREAVNRKHQKAGGAVEDDRVPETNELELMLKGAGFVNIQIIDEPDFHWATAAKP